jgi:hypothetical protein
MRFTFGSMILSALLAGGVGCGELAADGGIDLRSGPRRRGRSDASVPVDGAASDGSVAPDAATAGDASLDAPRPAGDAGPAAAACADWPDDIDDPSLPYAGVFYGSAMHADATGNSAQFRYEASRRFRAERTGAITAIRYNNRTLTDANIESRCASSPGSIWCECLAGGLDRITCGYHLPNSYSVGTGGILTIEIHGDDGSAAHLPSPEILATTVRTIVPIETEEYPELALDRPVMLRAGCIYHVLYRQMNPPIECTRSSLPVDEAALCDRDRGAVGLNGVSFVHEFEPLGGPFYGATAAMLRRNSASEGWTIEDDMIPWLEVGYDDGTWVGDFETFDRSLSAGHEISGTRKVRERFTVQDATRRVTGVWMRVARISASTGPLVVTLARGGTVLETVSVTSSSVDGCSDCVDPEDAFRTSTIGWTYVPFESVHELALGQEHVLELSASSGGRYGASAGFPMDYSPIEARSRSFWDGARAEHTVDGRTWQTWAGTYRPERDLPVLFTVEGAPTSLP